MDFPAGKSALRVELCNIAELLLARGYQGINGDCPEFVEVVLEHRAEQSCAGFAICMHAVRRLGDDRVHAAQRDDLGRGDAQRFGGESLFAGVIPHD